MKILAEDDGRAVVQTSTLEITFGIGRGNVLGGSLIRLRNPPEGIEADAESSLWAAFLGATFLPEQRDRNGWALRSLDKQVREELTLIGGLIREIFCDPQKTRDAVYFVEGYTMAYTQAAENGSKL